MMRPARLLLAALCFSTAAACAQPADQPADQPPPPAAEPATIELRSGLFIDRVTRGGRELVRLDPVAAAMARGGLGTVEAGSEIKFTDQSRAWTQVDADDKGEFPPSAGRGGYGRFIVESDQDRIMILEARAHALVYIAGEPRMGDPYAAGYVQLPVKLRAGSTELLFAIGGRAPLKATLRPPRAPVEIERADATLPDLVEDSDEPLPMGVIVRNATDSAVTPWVQWRIAGQEAWTDAGNPSGDPIVPPLSSRKIAVTPWIDAAMRAAGADRKVQVEVRTAAQAEGPWDSATYTLRVRNPLDTRKITFVSVIDGSVQYYAARPALESATAGASAPGLVLSLHGASVEAINQADSYSSKPDLAIIAPTNRRPFGFDWEDWGRKDGIEVMNLAVDRFKTDPTRQYLTGHSMGGHGTWQLGVHFPGRFAAIAPSAGWISFATYAAARGNETGSEPQSVEEMVRRGAASSDTLALLSNLQSTTVAILHGDADDNVPVSEARRMKDELTKAAHPDWRLWEEPGAGHWWDQGQWGWLPGAACTDYPPIFDLFARRRLAPADELTAVDFSTVSPAVSDTSGWVRVVRQTRPMALSRVQLVVDRQGRKFRGTTSNIDRLGLDLSVLRGQGAVTLEIDGLTSTLDGASGWVTLARHEDGWRIADVATLSKSGHTVGPFKEAFDRRFVLVYGTLGSPEENAWSFARARYDAEQWWYRGNGAAEIVADRDLGAIDHANRNLILYGNAATNAGVRDMLTHAPVQVKPGAVTIDGRDVGGNDLAVLMVYPDASGSRLIGVVGGTGLAGMRATDRAAYFVSGVGVPDVVVYGVEMFEQGAAGLKAAGFFGPDWSVASGVWAWSEPAASQSE